MDLGCVVYLYFKTSLLFLLIMIDISQWRARIGLWCCRKNSLWETSTDTASVLSGEGLPRNREGGHNVMSSLVLYLLLLILSGDIELNPGPKIGI